MRTSKGNAGYGIIHTSWAIALLFRGCKLLLVVACMLASLPSFAGSLIAWGSGLGTNVPLTLTNVTSIAAGLEHCVVLLSDGSVRAWGNNSYTQTNVPEGLSNVVLIAGGLAAGTLIFRRIRGSHGGNLWPLILSSAGFMYLWWLAAILFDLCFTWQRYVRLAVWQEYLAAAREPRLVRERELQSGE